MDLNEIQKMDLREIVISMREPYDFITIIENEDNILSQCILARKFLSSNQWGQLLEKIIKKKFRIQKAINETSGDGVINGLNIEIKISLGDMCGKINFVQIRPDHNIDYYLLLAYNLWEAELGEVYWFLCPATDLYALIPEYGNYAHGTISKLGKITKDNIYGSNKEYALRPNPTSSSNTKSYKLWQLLLKKFWLTEDEIYNFLNSALKSSVIEPD